MSFPRYPAYKPSGVEWLGEVPEHWGVLQSRRMFKARREAAKEGAIMLTASQKYGMISQAEFVEREGRRVVEVIQGKDNLIKVEPGDFVISMRSFQGGLEWCRLSGSTSFHYVPVTPIKHVVPSFFAHLMKSDRYISALRATTNLIRDGQEIRYSNFVQVPLPIIPESEQIAISSFLDRETAKIDALIAEQQRLIELLQEKRQAVISHAVTKGLNPNAPMKDSGVEWLGEVPEHWETGKIKHYFRTTSGSTPNSDKPELYYTTEEDEQGTPWIRTTDIDDGEVKAAAVFITPKALGDTACKPLPVNTVLVALYGGGGTVGKNGILKIEAAVNQALCGILPSSKALPEYVHRYIQFLRPFWMERAVSARKAGNISQELVGDTIFPMPPLEEQTAILRSLEVKLEELDELAGQSSASLGLLEERRSALISAAVTGQIDVRGLVEAGGGEQ